MEFYPLFLRLRDQSVLIVGGGRVAERKARRLVAAGARVKVVAPDIAVGIRSLATSCETRPATEEDIQPGTKLVILATNNATLHDRLSRKCLSLGILYNRCDDADQSEFVTGAIVDLSPFIGTVIASGSPGVARLARQRMEAAIEPALQELAGLMNSLRDRIHRTFSDPDERRAFHARWETEQTVQRIREEGIQAVAREIEQCLCC